MIEKEEMVFPLPTEADMKACKWMQASASCVLLEELSNRPCTGKGHFLVQEETRKSFVVLSSQPCQQEALLHACTCCQVDPVEEAMRAQYRLPQ